MSDSGAEFRDAASGGAEDRDEELLIDLALGRCDQETSEQARRRLAADAGLAKRFAEISSALAALGRWRVPGPSANLLESTMARVEAQRRSEALAAERQPFRRLRMPAFSLRELATLAAAAVLVVGILLPAVQQARRFSERTECAANIGQIGTALGSYAYENDDYLPASPANEGSWLGADGTRRASNSAGLFVLVRKGLAPAGLFRCPAGGGDQFEYRAGMADFPARTVGYSYHYSLSGPLRRADLADVADEMVILVDENPVFAGGVFRPERLARTVSDNHSDGGQNVLRLNMAVAWTRDCKVGVNHDNIFLADGVTNYTGNEKPASRTDTFVLPSPSR